MNALAHDAMAGRVDEVGEDKAKARQVTRVQLDLPPRSMKRLAALKEKTEASSYVEVIKNALQLYEGLIEEVEQGKQFLVRAEDGTVSPFRLFL
jgi:hypothetical protein